ncbi:MULTISPECIES: hypothetical protein [unclassified Cryobacterium]|nr:MULTISPECIES: hypothetical protein [unclassified Cryobacterium]MDY7543608.1 hypothetical protein [Cryobacterium sp. 5B3]MEA9998705.1 hypothetical protein [Cryobacterium sp. RTS3]MEB0266477.1 hypothetical protein [Cryobacterium sp. 10I5]MEB0273036.1 hypothetical protein [Cryobacterium sp. 5B3]
MDPFIECLWIMFVSCVVAGALSLVTGDISWVDPQAVLRSEHHPVRRVR